MHWLLLTYQYIQQLQMVLSPDQSILLVDQIEPFMNILLFFIFITSCYTDNVEYHVVFQEFIWNQLSLFLSMCVSYPSPWAFGVFSPRLQLCCLCASARFPGPEVHSVHIDWCPADTGQEVPQGDIHKTRQEQYRQRKEKSEKEWRLSEREMERARYRKINDQRWWEKQTMTYKDNGEERTCLI